MKNNLAADQTIMDAHLNNTEHSNLALEEIPKSNFRDVITAVAAYLPFSFSVSKQYHVSHKKPLNTDKTKLLGSSVSLIIVRINVTTLAKGK